MLFSIYIFRFVIFQYADAQYRVDWNLAMVDWFRL